MKSHWWVLFALLIPGAASAEIYKRVDDSGHVTYSSTPIKGGKKVHLEPLPIMDSTPVAPKTVNRDSERFPKVNSETQSRRDDARRRILEDELASEQQELDASKKQLKDAQDNPEVYHVPGSPIVRNMDKYEEKLNTLQEEVSSHEKNITAIQTEISNLK